MVKNHLVNEITESEFSTILKDKKNKLVVIDFFAEWCMPCVMMGPVFESLAENNKKAKFAKVNVDDSPNLAQKYEISSIPCIVFFQDGKEVDRVVGSVGEDVLEEKVKDYLSLAE